ncbi:hypothetical protein E2I00_004099, partial [Balaenoptera physalus]
TRPVCPSPRSQQHFGTRGIRTRGRAGAWLPGTLKIGDPAMVLLPSGGQAQYELFSLETVLIHAGASDVGTAAIQLTWMAGASPLVTAGSQHKLQMPEKLGAA